MNIREKLEARRKVYPTDYWERQDKKRWKIMWACMATVVLSFIISFAVNAWVLFKIMR